MGSLQAGPAQCGKPQWLLEYEGTLHMSTKNTLLEDPGVKKRQEDRISQLDPKKHGITQSVSPRDGIFFEFWGPISIGLVTVFLHVGDGVFFLNGNFEMYRYLHQNLSAF